MLFRSEKSTTQPTVQPINIYSTDKNGFEGLSNLLNGPVKATINGVERTFKTVEHLYQVKKALFAGDRNAANQIFKASTGFEAQKLGSSKGPIQWTENSVEQWDTISSKELEDAMRLAFEQNQKAKDLLLKTGDAQLTHKTKFSLGKWETVFPEILMKIRNELKSQPTETSTETAQQTEDAEASSEIIGNLEGQKILDNQIDQIVKNKKEDSKECNGG